MSELMTDDEKVEAIKTWWRANGLAVGVGAAVGIAAVFGWRAWSAHQHGIEQRASLAFEQVLAAAAADKPNLAQITTQVESLTDEYDHPTYTFLAQLAQAKAAVTQGDLTTAANVLRTSVANAPEPALAKLAAVRLLQVLIAAGDYKTAAAVLKQHDDGGSFGAEFAVLRGDLAVAEKRYDDARVAYQAAMTLGAGTAQWVELKLRNLPAPAGVAVTPAKSAPLPAAPAKSEPATPSPAPAKSEPATPSPAPAVKSESPAAASTPAAPVKSESPAAAPVKSEPAPAAPLKSEPAPAAAASTPAAPVKSEPAPAAAPAKSEPAAPAEVHQ